jgi:hypothetical protein
LRIVLHPILDHGGVRGMILEELLFVPILLSTIRLSQIKRRLWPFVLLLAGLSFTFAVADKFWPNPAITSIKWGFVAVYFGVTVGGLFSYLANADSITPSHLYIAVSIYLLLGFLWFALYSAAACFSPDAILSSGRALMDSRSELLYFSLVTLTTLGYGDIVPIQGEVRMLAALEAVTGVLYVAITVGILVSSYRRQRST